MLTTQNTRRTETCLFNFSTNGYEIKSTEASSQLLTDLFKVAIHPDPHAYVQKAFSQRSRIQNNLEVFVLETGYQQLETTRKTVYSEKVQQRYKNGYTYQVRKTSSFKANNFVFNNRPRSLQQSMKTQLRSQSAHKKSS